MRAGRLAAGVALAALLLGGRAAAQAPVLPATGQVDRVVAVVGYRPILSSEVDEQFFALLSQFSVTGPKTAADTARLRLQIINDMIDDELMVQQAGRDSTIKVTDQEVIEGVEQTVRGVRQRYPSEFEFSRELRKAGFLSIEEYRRFMIEQTRRDMMRSQLVQKLKDEGKLKPVQPSEKEMRAFFDEQRPQFGKRPATISFRQVVLAPRPTEAAQEAAHALADSILRELKRGADFATAARRFSADPGSRENGGDLGWSRRGVYVPEFERAAFSLKPGAISEPIETPFGFHIIQVMRSQAGEVQARHILLAPELTEADQDSALALAQRVYAQMKAGGSIDSLQRLHHDDTEEREAAAAPLDKLPEVYGRVLRDADSGSVVPPFAIEAPGGKRKFATLLVTERRAEGDIRYEDVRDRVRAALAEQLATRKYLDKLRRGTFIEVRET